MNNIGKDKAAANHSLYSKITDFENLYRAYRSARRGKRGKPGVADFERRQEDELL